MEPNRKLMHERAAWGFSSVTALAEAIQTKKKVSYRTAHRIVARAVLLAVEAGKDATGIDAALLDRAALEMTGGAVGFDNATIFRCLDPVEFIKHHAVVGGTAPSQVRAMAVERHKRLAADEISVADRRNGIATGKQLLREAVNAICAS
jgi:argininosuccinate lyase